MSHIPVLVVGPDWTEQLFPFQDLEGLRSADEPKPETAKWDWHTLGGRFACFFELKSGACVDRARKGEVDWLATWSRTHRRRSIQAYVKDGRWRERGGLAVEAWDRTVREIIDALPDDTLLALVDCHE